MKIIINYDLVNEILKANKGFNLKKFKTKFELYAGIITALNLTTLLATGEFDPTTYVSGAIYGTLVFGGSEIVTKEINKYEAEKRLRSLSSQLSKINIYTDADLLKEGQLYKTEYKLVKDNQPTIQQNKYIMIPTNGSLNANEVSLLQEHNIGSREYILSMGEPKKSYSKSYSRSLSTSFQ